MVGSNKWKKNSSSVMDSPFNIEIGAGWVYKHFFPQTVLRALCDKKYKSINANHAYHLLKIDYGKKSHIRVNFLMKMC